MKTNVVFFFSISVMVRHYVKKTDRGSYGNEKLRKALQELEKGIPLLRVSVAHGIPRRTLRRHRDNLVTCPGTVSLGRFKQNLPSTSTAPPVSTSTAQPASTSTAPPVSLPTAPPVSLSTAPPYGLPASTSTASPDRDLFIPLNGGGRGEYWITALGDHIAREFLISVF
jgi:hypothetical protein